MTTMRRISRFNVSEKAKTELFFVGQCLAAAGVFAAVIAFAVGR